MKRRPLNSVEIAQILAALRLWQHEECADGALHFDGEDIQPMDDAEIDELCETINCDGISVPQS